MRHDDLHTIITIITSHAKDLCDDKDLRDDLIQEVWVVVVPQMEKVQHPDAYLRAVTKNTLAKMRRQRQGQIDISKRAQVEGVR